jgi:hypothetical protein
MKRVAAQENLETTKIINDIPKNSLEDFQLMKSLSESSIDELLNDDDVKKELGDELFNRLKNIIDDNNFNKVVDAGNDLFDLVNKDLEINSINLEESSKMNKSNIDINNIDNTIDVDRIEAIDRIFTKNLGIEKGSTSLKESFPDFV